MGAKILKEFWDKYNNTRYKVGDIVNFSKKRLKELQILGFIEKVETDKKK